MSEQVIDSIFTDIGEMDQNFWEQYEHAQAFVGNPVPGAYPLRMPENLPDSAFVIQNDGKPGRDGKERPVNPKVNDGKPYLEITLDNGTNGLTIVGGEFDGADVRFVRVDTKRIKEYKNRKPTGRFVKGNTALDVLANFGTRDEIATVEDLIAAFRRLEGQETPVPVRLTYGAYDKHAVGNARYLRAKDFPKGQNFVDRVAVVPFVNKKGEQVNVGDTYRVYANLVLGYRGFSPIVEK